MIFVRPQRINKGTKMINSIKNKKNVNYIEQRGGKCPTLKLLKLLYIVFVLFFFSKAWHFFSTEASFINKQKTTNKNKISISLIEISCDKQYDNDKMK